MGEESRKRKDPSTELSKRMLGGWILLAESCALGCNVPLVENKKQKKIQCVNCDTFFTRDADKMVPVKDESTSAASTAAPPPSASSIPPPATAGGASIPAPARDEEDFDYYEDDEEFVPPSKEELERIEQRMKKSNEVSKLMGEKLLLGWTLLSDVCPKPDCYQPLMRDPQKQMWCLACNTRVVRQEDFDPTKHKLVSDSDKAPSATLNAAPSPSIPPTPSDSKFTSFSAPAKTPSKPAAPAPPQENNNAPAPTSPAPTSPTKPSSSTTAGVPFQFPASTSNPNLNLFTSPPAFRNTHGETTRHENSQAYSTRREQVDYTLHVLYIKLHDLSARLAQETHPHEITQLCAAIKECGLAIAALTK